MFSCFVKASFALALVVLRCGAAGGCVAFIAALGMEDPHFSGNSGGLWYTSFLSLVVSRVFCSSPFQTYSRAVMFQVIGHGVL